MKKTAFCWVGVAAWLFARVAIASSAGLSVEDPWVRAAPPGAVVLAGYMTIRNDSDRVHALVAASSPSFGKVLLHRSVIENGMATMIPQRRVEVPAKGTISFAPNGYHLMLMQAQQSFKVGDEVKIVLQFDDGTQLPVRFLVRKGAATHNMHDMQHMHE